jgi:hypothetical protein
MNMFQEIFWWFGITLFTVSIILFYGLLSYKAFQYIKNKFK